MNLFHALLPWIIGYMSVSLAFCCVWMMMNYVFDSKTQEGEGVVMVTAALLWPASIPLAIFVAFMVSTVGKEPDQPEHMEDEEEDDEEPDAPQHWRDGKSIRELQKRMGR